MAHKQQVNQSTVAQQVKQSKAALMVSAVNMILPEAVFLEHTKTLKMMHHLVLQLLLI